MPVQSSFAAYYFLQAFAAVPELVGAGLPFELLQIGSTVTFGAYSSALIFNTIAPREGVLEGVNAVPAVGRAGLRLGRRRGARFDPEAGGCRL